MPAYVMAHVHATDFGPEIIEYLRGVDATMQPFGGRLAIRRLRTENTTADTVMFDGLPAGCTAKSALDHALSATKAG